MPYIDYEEFNQTRNNALEHAATENNLDLDHMKNNNAHFFTCFETCFEWIFLVESTRQDLIDYLDINIEQLKEYNAATVKEYLVLSHDDIYTTPYGFVYYRRD